MQRLCVFDLDGTLVDSISDISASMNYALTLFDCPVHTEDEYCQMVGNGMNLLCQRALPEGKKECWEELVQAYHMRYIDHCCDHSRPYEGILELLRELERMKITAAVLSNKPHAQTVKMIKALFPAETFALVLGQREEFPRKPDPAALDDLMRRANAERESTVYIGDSAVDVQLGQNAGVDAVGVAWGLRGQAELRAAGAVKIARDPQELLGLLQEKFR